MSILRTSIVMAPLARLAVAAADAPQTRAGQYRNVMTVGAERYIVTECRAAAPITVGAAEGSCEATRSWIGAGTINVALVCPNGKRKTITGFYSPNGFTIRTLAEGYRAGPAVSQVISTRIGDCTPKK